MFRVNPTDPVFKDIDPTPAIKKQKIYYFKNLKGR